MSMSWSGSFPTYTVPTNDTLCAFHIAQQHYLAGRFKWTLHFLHHSPSKLLTGQPMYDHCSLIHYFFRVYTFHYSCTEIECFLFEWKHATHLIITVSFTYIRCVNVSHSRTHWFWTMHIQSPHKCSIRQYPRITLCCHNTFRLTRISKLSFGTSRIWKHVKTLNADTRKLLVPSENLDHHHCACIYLTVP